MSNMLYLMADLAGSRVAIDSSQVESIIHLPDVVPVPMCDPSIAGIFALRSRVLTLIDTQFLITGVQQAAHKGTLAVVTEIAGHQYGLLVDKVHDVVPISIAQAESNILPPTTWNRYVDQVAMHEGELVMILNTDALVSGQTVPAS
jgi:purine-binding chemotaxis protein CheW